MWNARLPAKYLLEKRRSGDDTSPSAMSDLYPIHERMLTRAEREAQLGQRAKVVWLFGLSGSGKSTLATALERKLFAEGLTTALLDGDNLRTGLNKGLGFTDADREENIRRVAEVSKLFLNAGIVCINSFITPRSRCGRWRGKSSARTTCWKSTWRPRSRPAESGT